MAERLSNKQITLELKEALAAMEVLNENRFSVRAYQNAIAAIDGLTISVYDLYENDRLDEIPGVGAVLKQHIIELLTKGKVKDWEEKKKDLPQGMFPLLVVRGIGPKTAYKLAEKFKLNKRETVLEKVKDLAEKGKIRELSGFGEKSEKDILDSIENLKTSKQEKPRMLLSVAEEIAERVVSYLKQEESVVDAVPLGSLRRHASTVGDLDIAVASNDAKAVIDHFVKFSEIKSVESQGDHMSTVILGNDTQVDILVTEPDSLGSLLQHFTGSKQHNVKLRQYSLEKGLSLSQYGIKEKGKLKKFSKEEDFYKYLGLDYIVSELREGTNEIELGKNGGLPELVELKDIKGDLHMHTTDSDGVNSLEEMVLAAIDLGYEYIGIADHAPSVISRGKFEVLGIVDAKRRAIDEINQKYPQIKVLFGYEVNILKDATLGLPDEVMEKLDYVIASVHTSFDQTRPEVTKRVLAAIKNPHVKIIGHPTGRLINERNPIDLDWDVIFSAAKKYGKILEINSQPSRLDLPDNLVKEAVKMEIPLIINTDAHSVQDLRFMKYGVYVARRGWCEKKNIINTKKFSDILKI